MTDDNTINPLRADDRESREAPTTMSCPDPEYPDIPYPIVRPARGSPYYIHPRFGTKAHLFAPGMPSLTSEDVRRELEDFP